MNNMWSDIDYKSRFNVVKHFISLFSGITCKSNTDFCCCEFYKKIKSRKYFLKKVLSTEKCDWVNVMCKFTKCLNFK